MTTPERCGNEPKRIRATPEQLCLLLQGTKSIPADQRLH